MTSIIHPGCDSPSADSSSEAEASTTHWEVADKIPDQGCQLHDGREKGQNGRVELPQCQSKLLLESRDRAVRLTPAAK